ncbi:MAG: sigma-54-dependent Fis family transcriptional regulator [Bacteroidetes bacterium]|jgi:DNA-binding NtrC family response regulator|nr:sigma-54-dependent Fis family transcriptional regulator [Bacteroidota bacterium]MBT6685280.1 sigma-54-dependent Fis family transcriptional regulator [Bacteroidota bacterium]MBT7141727.1 sigma-54-dependent Fis family transcriptional regulator [Bacteroidota bacterium]MBT7491425.1 sigma-54-dependent Fis family transcriptional regulator [Bacteroidota bacterium]
MKFGKVLIVDDNIDILFSVKLLLKKHVELIHTETNPKQIPELMKNFSYDVILLDMNFTKDAISGQEGFDWLKKIIEIDPEAVVLFITAYGDTEKAVRAIKEGAVDFVIKPWQNEKFIATISSAIKLRKSKIENQNLRSKQKGLIDAIDQPFKDFIGKSPAMMQVYATIKKVAETDASVLILGENGTGKEVVARALHRNSRRTDDVFVSVDLGSIAETLFESELFGHEKGAFTDAKKEKPGRFEISSGGTLFLDEIGNLSLPLQAKLLTVIERREVIRVGSNKSRSFDIRLICATNSSIHELAVKDEFRQDLLYRINTVEIQLPPLRERVEDIALLADHFLKIQAKKYKKNVKGISSSALKKLEQYAWPGNIRELQHAIERAVIMTDSSKLENEDFILLSKTKSNEVELKSYNLDEVEKNIINKVLAKNKGNVSHAAKELGLTRTSLYRRLEKHGL